MKTTETRTDTNIQETLCLNSAEHPLGGSEREQHVSVYVGGTCALSLSLTLCTRAYVISYSVHFTHTVSIPSVHMDLCKCN